MKGSVVCVQRLLECSSLYLSSKKFQMFFLVCELGKGQGRGIGTRIAFCCFHFKNSNTCCVGLYVLRVLPGVVLSTTFFIRDINIHILFTVVETQALRDKQTAQDHAIDFKSEVNADLSGSKSHVVKIPALYCPSLKSRMLFHANTFSEMIFFFFVSIIGQPMFFVCFEEIDSSVRVRYMLKVTYKCNCNSGKIKYEGHINSTYFEKHLTENPTTLKYLD